MFKENKMDVFHIPIFDSHYLTPDLKPEIKLYKSIPNDYFLIKAAMSWLQSS